MNFRLLLAFIVIPLFSTLAFGEELTAPVGSTKESRSTDMGKCLGVAQGAFSLQDSYSFLGIFDDLKKYVLKDRNTGGFVYTTALSGRSSPVVNDEG